MKKILSRILMCTLIILLFCIAVPYTVSAKKITSQTFVLNKDHITSKTTYTNYRGYGFVTVKYNDDGYWENLNYHENTMLVTNAYNKSINNNKNNISIKSTKMSIPSNKPTRATYIDTKIQGAGFRVNLKNGNYRISVVLSNPKTYTQNIAGLINGEQLWKGIDVKAKKEKTITYDYAVINEKIIFQIYDTKFKDRVYIKSIKVKALPKKAVKAKKTMYLYGDSTTRYYSKDVKRGSLGTGFIKYFGKKPVTKKLSCINNSSATVTNTSTTTIKNYSKSGVSAKFLKLRGIRNKMLLDISNGDTIYICIGHNDEHSDRSFVNTTITQYKQELQSLIYGIKQRGGKAVLVSPIAGYRFNPDGTNKTLFTSIRDVMQKVADKNNCIYINLGEVGQAYIDTIGKEKAQKMYMCYYDGTDCTHLTKYGGEIQSKFFYELTMQTALYKNCIQL